MINASWKRVAPVLRIAWRDARRNRWRSVLVVALVAVPIAALAMGSVVFATGAPAPEEYATGQMGAADVIVYGADGAELAGRLPTGSRLATVLEAPVRSAVDGGIASGVIEAVTGDAALLDGRYRLLDGRLPGSDGEVALSPQFMESFGVEVGDRLVVGEPALDLLTVGTVVRPEALATSFGLTLPPVLEPMIDAGGVEVGVTTYVASSDAGGSLPRAIVEGPHPFNTREGVRQSATIGGLIPYSVVVVVVIVALAETSLIVAAAFAVGARRQLRNLGLIGAAGGSPRHVRAVVLSSGVVLGALGSLVGVALGIAGGIAIAPRLDTLLDRLTGPLVIPPGGMLLAMALGTLAAVIAAWVPARTAARISVLDALAARTPPPPSPRRTAGWGLVTMIVGAALLAWGTVAGSLTLLTVGLVGMLAGVLLIIPIAVSRIERMAGRLPLMLRIAGRDAGRHARRTGAAVAAATLALGLPVAMSALTLSDEAAYQTVPAMAEDHLMVERDVAGGGPVPAMVSSTVEGDGATDGIVDAVAAAVPVVASSELVATTLDADRYHRPDDAYFVYAWREPDPGAAQFDFASGPLMLADESLLEVLRAEAYADDLAAGKVLAIGTDLVRDGEVMIDLPPTLAEAPDADWAQRALPAVETGGPEYPSLATFLIAPQRAAELGLEPGYVMGTAIRTAEPMTGDALATAKDAAATAGGAVWALADTDPGGGMFRTVVLLSSTVVALATIGVAVALVAVETRRDQAVLAAVGAAPGTRRRIVAGTALLVAVLAGLLAVPAGFLPVAVVQSFRAGGYPIVVPWLTIASAVVAVPALAGAGAALLTRSPTSHRMINPA